MAAHDLPHFGPASTDGLRDAVGEPPLSTLRFADGTPIPDEPSEDEDAEIVDITDAPGWVGNPRNEHVATVHGGRRRTVDEPDRALPNYDPTLYAEHPVLTAIRDHAHALCVGADALLLSVLAFVSGSIPGGLVIDSGVRRPAIPGLFACLCADSGVGKTVAAGVAQDLLDVPTAYSLSTGEGLLESYYGSVDTYNAKGDKAGTRRAVVRHNALFTADEGQTVFAEMAREGSKLGAILRSFWSGSGVGTANASHERNRSLARGTYNGAVLIGLQPALVGELVGDTTLGTAQRWLWAAAHDVNLNPAAPAWSGPLFIEPHLPHDTDGQPVITDQVFTVATAITTELRDAEVAKVTLRVAVDEQDSQRAVMLLKLAATLAWIDSRVHIEVGDWQLAGAILAESNRVRDALLETAEQQARDRLTRVGHERAAVRAAETGRDRAISEVKSRLVDVLGKAGEPMPVGRLRNSVSKRGPKRELASDALDLLVSDGAVVQATTPSGTSGYALSPEGRREWMESDLT